jgi:hypothetical protein
MSLCTTLSDVDGWAIFHFMIPWLSFYSSHIKSMTPEKISYATSKKEFEGVIYISFQNKVTFLPNLKNNFWCWIRFLVFEAFLLFPDNFMWLEEIDFCAGEWRLKSFLKVSWHIKIGQQPRLSKWNEDEKNWDFKIKMKFNFLHFQVSSASLKTEEISANVAREY